jgi:hypothetical protein
MTTSFISISTKRNYTASKCPDACYGTAKRHDETAATRKNSAAKQALNPKSDEADPFDFAQRCRTANIDLKGRFHIDEKSTPSKGL